MAEELFARLYLGGKRALMVSYLAHCNYDG